MDGFCLLAVVLAGRLGVKLLGEQTTVGTPEIPVSHGREESAPSHSFQEHKHLMQ